MNRMMHLGHEKQNKEYYVTSEIVRFNLNWYKIDIVLLIQTLESETSNCVSVMKKDRLLSTKSIDLSIYAYLFVLTYSFIVNNLNIHKQSFHLNVIWRF
jgi:hypothetical protein